MSRILPKAVAACSLCLIAAWITPFVMMGLVRSGNVLMFLIPLAWLCAGCLWLAALIGAFRYLRLRMAQQHSGLGKSWVAVVLYFATPFIMRATTPAFIRLAELRDLQVAGVSSLRAEAKKLSSMYVENSHRFPGRYFGGEVPKELMSLKLRELSIHAAYVAASEEGVVLVTDGVGRWRGGYMIVPTGSKYIPENGRQIAEGIYYVITR